MKAFLTLFIVLGIFTDAAFCQLQLNWQQCFGGSKTDVAYDLVQAGDGFIISGSTASDDGDISFNHGGADYWIVRTDGQGNLLWEKTFGGTHGDWPDRILKTADCNGYYVVGSTYSTDGDVTNPYPGAVNNWAVKIDSTGNIIWERVVGNTVGNAYSSVMDAIHTLDGGVVFTGNMSAGGGDVSLHYGWFDLWVIKLDGQGNTDWDFTIGSAGSENGGGLLQTSDGGYLVGGSGRPNGEGNITCTPFNGNSEAILFKLDALGNEQWQQCYGGSDNEGISGFVEVDDGYIFSAFGNSGDGDLTGSGWHGESDIWLVKIDFSGNIIWQKCYGGSNGESARNIFSTSDGGFMVFGNTYSFDGDVVGNPSLNEYRPTIWVFKIDSAGTLLWQQCIGGIADEHITSGVVQKSDNSYVVGGTMVYSPSFDVDCPGHVNNGYTDYWLFEISDTTVGISDFQVTGDGIDIKVYPNPASTQINFDYQGHVNNGKGIIQIWNTHGKMIHSTIISQPKGTDLINIEDWQKGLYIYSLIFGDHNAKGKFIINR